MGWRARWRSLSWWCRCGREEEGLKGKWEWVLQEMVEGGGQRVGETSLFGGEERAQLLVEWNRTEAAYPQRCVQELFEEQVERSPAGVALVGSEGEEMSYEELNRR